MKEHLKVLNTGLAGVGKTWLAWSLVHKACREGFTAQYVRLTRVLRELIIATSQLPIEEWHGVIGAEPLIKVIKLFALFVFFCILYLTLRNKFESTLFPSSYFVFDYL